MKNLSIDPYYLAAEAAEDTDQKLAQFNLSTAYNEGRIAAYKDSVRRTVIVWVLTIMLVLAFKFLEPHC